ncbi:hypothetical protein [Streptomyces sp. NPDC058985]|uniref:hypothetical protein n=1 Tax=Streptomyces sp. NPDC058985 TaxID=3346684 RepID=UPI0036A3EB69
MDEALVIQGSGRRHVLRGRAAGKLLPGLLPLLDGSRDAVEVAAELDVPVDFVERVLALLGERDLLDLTGPLDDTEVPEHVIDHHARSLDTSGGHLGVAALLGTLAATAVHVTGVPGVASAIAADLQECGIRDAAAGPLDHVRAEALGRAQYCLVVVVEDGSDPECLNRTTTLCGPLGVPVLRVATTGDQLEVGPCFQLGFTACPDCLRRGRHDAGWSCGEADDDLVAEPPATHRTDRAVTEAMLAGLAAEEVFALASGRPSQRMTMLRRIRVGDWETERFVVVPATACTCSNVGGSRSEPDLVEAFMWQTENSLTPRLRQSAPSRSLQARRKTQAVQRPSYHSRPCHSLPTSTLPIAGTYGEALASDRRPAPWGLPQAADLLARVGGLRRGTGDKPSQRWVASGGGRGSVELYLLTSSGFAELPGNVFRYDDLAHRLIALRADPLHLPDVLADTDLDADDLDAVMVFSAAHGRLARKYEEFAYRLAHLDAGCAATQLSAVSTARGWTVRFATRWSEAFADLLDLSPDVQYVTAVAGLHTR